MKWFGSFTFVFTICTIWTTAAWSELSGTTELELLESVTRDQSVSLTDPAKAQSTRGRSHSLDFAYDCVECPAGAVQESETCGDNSSNTACILGNGATVDQISCGQTVCGNIYEYYSGNSSFDWDVFEFTLTEESTVTICAASPTAVVHGWISVANCTGLTDYFDHHQSNAPCGKACVTACLPAGTYWYWISGDERSSLNFNGCIPYTATFTCEPGCEPCIDCPAGAIVETEACPRSGSDVTNGGCYDGNQFTDIECGDIVCGSVHTIQSPSAWDMDWYRVTVTEQTNLKWYLASPNSHVQVWIAQEGPGGCGAPNFDVIYHAAASRAGVCDTICATYCADPGTYFLVVRPDFEDQNYGFYDIDCAPYTAWLTCEPVCAPCITCPPGAVVENENCPRSGPDGGCENFVSLDCGSRYCGSVSGDRGNSVRDSDWFVLTVSEEQHYSICIENDGLLHVGVFEYTGPLCSPSNGYQDVRELSTCEGTCFEYCLPSGTYNIFLSGTYENELDESCVNYSLSIDCRDCGDIVTCAPDPEILNLDPATDQQSSHCLFLCPEDSTLICVGPGLDQSQQPLIYCEAGCFSSHEGVPAGGCDVDCAPTLPLEHDWWYDPTTTSWYRWIHASPATGPGCVCCYFDTILPVELNSFEAIPGDEEITLRWSTESELNNDHFEVERDGQLVFRLSGAGTSISPQEYSWTDLRLTNGREYSYSLFAVDMNGVRENVSTVSATPRVGVGTVEAYALHQNYPNPFNPTTSINYDLVEPQHVTLRVYNPLGQTVATLVNSSVDAGRHSVDFDASELSSGLYFYSIDAGDFKSVRKMILMK